MLLSPVTNFSPVSLKIRDKFIADVVVTSDKFFTSITENSGQGAIAGVKRFIAGGDTGDKYSFANLRKFL
jgi:hypothetical protein